MNDENTKVVDEKVVEDENEKQEIILINEETIQSKIYIVRGQKVMLDFNCIHISILRSFSFSDFVNIWNRPNLR